MISHYSLKYNEWTAITDVNKSGTCWLASQTGKGTVRVYHAVLAPDVSESIYGYPVYIPKGNNKAVTISVDNTTTDIYYAIIDQGDSTSTAVIVTDVK